MVDHVLVPMDHSPLARRALEYALSVHTSAKVTVIYVVDYVEESYSAEMLVGPEELRERVREKADEIFEEASEIAADVDRELNMSLKFGDPARTILEFAETEDVDVIVIGSHGRPFLTRVLLGDTTNKIVHRASVPVTVVR